MMQPQCSVSFQNGLPQDEKEFRQSEDARPAAPNNLSK